MARKRMFDNELVSQDSFLDLPKEAIALYFLLGMNADDEGFIAPKKVLRLYNIAEDNLKVLIAKEFVIPFETGVVVITDWKRNNYLNKNKVVPTIYQEEKKQLLYDPQTQKYQWLNQSLTEVKPEFNKSLDSIEEYSIEENSIVEYSIEKEKDKKKKNSTEFDEVINSNFTDKEVKEAIYEFIKMRKAIKKPLTTRGLQLMIKKLYSITTNIDEQIEILNNSIMNNWQGIFPLKKNKTNGFNDFEELWKEAKEQDVKTRNNANNSNASW